MGKTTIAKILNFCKIPIFDADEEVKKILDNNVSIINKIKSKWPECIYLQNNKEIIDKKKIGSFGDINVTSIRSEKMIGVGEGGILSFSKKNLYKAKHHLSKEEQNKIKKYLKNYLQW